MGLNLKKHFQDYINWLLHLGRAKAVLFGFFLLAFCAIITQVLLSILFTGKVQPSDIIRSAIFGLFSAPFILYFFVLIVEKLELSRRNLANSVEELFRLRAQDKRLNMELEQQADFLQSFFDASPDLIFYRNADGYYLGCNHAMEVLTGKSKEEIAYLMPDQIFDKEYAKTMLDTDRETLDSNSIITYEQWIRIPSGKLSCFEIRKVPYYDRARQQDCILAFGRDITERKRYQETIEKNSRDKTILMATISHELRTPLNGIIGLSRMLLEGELLEQQREYLKTINLSAISLAHIFSDIIDLEKLDSRRIELNLQSVEFSQIINDISLFAKLMSEKKKIKFHIDYDEDLPVFIETDNARLSQILWNLVNNAVKFTPIGGDIYLTVNRKADNRFSFTLKDTGIGIPKAEQKKIFAMFYQTDKGRKSQGSGIGLAVSRHIAKLMGGNIRVESEENKGSTFTLTIQAKTSRQDSPIEINQHALKVLLVEDVEVNIVVARAMLEKFGCEVDVAMTGKEAFQKFAENSYDLVLLDIQLPDMTGIDIARQWREQYEASEIDYLPLLVALTANVIQSKEQYQVLGLDDVLRKPLSLEALSNCLNNYFGDSDEFMQNFAENAPLATDNVENEMLPAPFDKEMLRELLQVMDKKSLLENIALFENVMPSYLDELNGSLVQWQQSEAENDKKAVMDYAHKIKGSFASVRLSRLQEIAQQAQSEGTDWNDCIESWVSQINDDWQNDLAQARAWIEQQ